MFDTAMREIVVRQRHLDAMGITQWHARYCLAGAAKSEPITSGSFFLSDSISDINVASEDVGVEEQGSSVLDSLLRDAAPEVPYVDTVAPLESVDDAALKLAKVIGIDEVQASAESKLPELKRDSAKASVFSLVLYRAGGVLVISESDDGLAHVSELNLLKGITRFLKSEDAEECQYEASFHWPVFKRLPQDSATHERLLSMWLDSSCEHSVDVFLYLGCKNSDIRKHSIDRVIGLGCTEGRVLALPFSLSELVHSPSNKSDIWFSMVKSRLTGPVCD